MDVALTNSIVNTATSLASAKTSDVLNMVVLKKALDKFVQEIMDSCIAQGANAEGDSVAAEAIKL